MEMSSTSSHINCFSCSRRRRFEWDEMWKKNIVSRSMSFGVEHLSCVPCKDFFSIICIIVGDDVCAHTAVVGNTAQNSAATRRGRRADVDKEIFKFLSRLQLASRSVIYERRARCRVGNCDKCSWNNSENLFKPLRPGAGRWRAIRIVGIPSRFLFPSTLNVHSFTQSLRLSQPSAACIYTTQFSRMSMMMNLLHKADARAWWIFSEANRELPLGTWKATTQHLAIEKCSRIETFDTHMPWPGSTLKKHKNFLRQIKSFRKQREETNEILPRSSDVIDRRRSIKKCKASRIWSESDINTTAKNF